MKPTQLDLFRHYGAPTIAPDGQVVAALMTPDLAHDRYQSTVRRLALGLPELQLTRGPRDTAPVFSPHGDMVVFLRAGASGPPQAYVLPRDGGEPFALCEHPLGVSSVTFSPDGRRIAYLAAVPEPGRYGTAVGDDAASAAGVPTDGTPAEGVPTDGADEAGRRPDAAAEAPRRIVTAAYRLDGKGFVGDKREQIFVVDLVDGNGGGLPESTPRQVTAEEVAIGRPSFTPDGRELVYERASAVDAQTSQIAAIAADAAEPSVGRLVLDVAGDAARPVVHEGTLLYIGAAFDGHDFAGQTPALWAVPFDGGEPRRLTDEATVHVQADAGEPTVVGDNVLVAVQNRGAVELVAVPLTSARAPLSSLPRVVTGQRAVMSFAVAGDRVAAVVAGPESCGDVVTGVVDELMAAAATGVAAELLLTDVSAPLRAAGLASVTELNGAAPDGYPVHGWLVLPPGDSAGPHPVLLMVHGGPFAQYTWGVFDEAQMYASAGYAVVMGNPRGSSGYGLAHGRAPVGALGTVDADDVLALLDAALTRDDLDASRVGVLGGSYGGFMTSWLASHAPGRFVAGISERAVNAWDSFTGSSDIGYFFADAYVGSDLAAQRDRSPLYHADDIDIPLLIIHSEQDWRCPLEQAQRLYVALKQRNAEVEMLVFPGEGHELSRSGRPRHRAQRFDAILEWWQRYLPV